MPPRRTQRDQAKAGHSTPDRDQTARSILGLTSQFYKSLKSLDAAKPVVEAFLHEPSSSSEMLDAIGATSGRIVIELCCIAFSRGGFSLTPEEVIQDAAALAALYEIDPELRQAALDAVSALPVMKNEARTAVLSSQKRLALESLAEMRGLFPKYTAGRQDSDRPKSSSSPLMIAITTRTQQGGEKDG